MYPFSTTHKLDYENLRDVYMDVTFHREVLLLNERTNVPDEGIKVVKPFEFSQKKIKWTDLSK
ncbi:hypothetical protein Glove_423g29 [Diversispora epigaea]|uniref:Uncharacterized protein n=1 Tax=Diversispora epigaea TaxID=1348612 RepID=A0A397H2W7_9GLOM|nr:hypothetical protein Glove_423g29 [Diversispora epigaea]